ncbi:hypothetical protein SUGI_0882870 [Cryptomeria japonica]|nr:hypothetical protein SUGI_0882870 [Cryptomeria japonica]
MEFSPINKRISLPIPKLEYPETGAFNKEMLQKIFNFDCPHVEKALRVIVGEPLLDASRRILFPSQVASCFLSNSMDLLQSFALVLQLTVSYVKENYIPYQSLYLAVKDYDLHNGKALVGGLFRHKDLKKNSGFLCVYDAIKKGLFENDKTVVENAIAAHKKELGTHLCGRVMETFGAMIDLLNPFVPPPGFTSAADGE